MWSRKQKKIVQWCSGANTVTTKRCQTLMLEGFILFMYRWFCFFLFIIIVIPADAIEKISFHELWATFCHPNISHWTRAIKRIVTKKNSFLNKGKFLSKTVTKLIFFFLLFHGERLSSQMYFYAVEEIICLPQFTATDGWRMLGQFKKLFSKKMATIWKSWKIL